jgi:hypothetical protein
MGKIDTSGWKEFQVGELFTAKRGKVKNIQPLCPGETPIIAAGAYNQGIAGMYKIDSAYENRITISCNGAGCGSTFYHPYKFNVNGDAITLMEKDSMSDKAKSFIACILNGAFTSKYSYEEKCSPQKALDEIVRLPATPDGAPDWDYMESYMATLETKVVDSLTLLQAAKDAEKKKVDTREWGEFKFGDLFDLHGIKQAKSQKLIPTVELSDGIPCVPYIVQSQFNNMVGRYVDKQWLIENNEPPVEGDALVLGVTLNACSYQPEEFGASQVITARSPCLNKNNGFFIAAIVRKRIEQFDYKEKPSFEKYRALKIMLPIDKTGQPDWAYMEEYMRKVEEKAKNVLNHFEKDRNGV